jgi:hypothetical protein
MGLDRIGGDSHCYLPEPGQATTLLLTYIYNTWLFLLWQVVGRFNFGNVVFGISGAVACERGIGRCDLSLCICFCWFCVEVELSGREGCFTGS